MIEKEVDSQQSTPDSEVKGGYKVASVLLALTFLLGTIVGYIVHYTNTPYLKYDVDDPQSVVFLKKKNYYLTYDGRTKNPIWVLENIFKDKSEKFSINTNSNFPIPQNMQNSLSDYQNSGFEVGNLLTSLGDTTFYVPATSPQVSQLNQGYWKKLEQYVQALPELHQISRIITITGPLYLPYQDTDDKRYVKYQVIGKDNIAVPTHFFKIIYFPPKSSSQPEVYLIPNEPINADSALENFKISFEKLEEISGISFPPSSNPYFMKPITGPL